MCTKDGMEKRCLKVEKMKKTKFGVGKWSEISDHFPTIHNIGRKVVGNFRPVSDKNTYWSESCRKFPTIFRLKHVFFSYLLIRRCISIYINLFLVFICMCMCVLVCSFSAYTHAYIYIYKHLYNSKSLV